MIRYANIGDLEWLTTYDHHIKTDELIHSIQFKKIMMILENGKILGWLRYNLFWDHIPFLNMLFIIEEKRKKGYGTQLLFFWESEMKKNGYNLLLTSTQSDEKGQDFYRKHLYVDCGSFELPEEVLEIILYKNI